MSEGWAPAGVAQAGHPPSFGDLVAASARVGLLGFGGPAGQIALMHRVFVEERGWLGERRFLHALNFCMLLPGPEAQQLATYIGWLLHGVRGGLVAGLLFILPGAALVMALSAVYAVWGELAWVAAAFYGLKAAVLAIVLAALQAIAKRALKGPLRLALAGAAFIALFVFDAPFPAVVLGAGLIGLLMHKGMAQAGDDAEEAAAGPAPSARAAYAAAAAALVLWLAPVLGLALWLGPDSVWSALAGFFSWMAVVTFGGAYAVLAYVAQEAVATHGWLAPGEMLDGLGLAETTPGPLILVLQFVGFLAAYRDPGVLPPLVAGVLGGLLTLWVTFAPCFVWIFAGGPHIERLRRAKPLAGALAAITAAVAGVILNLALWFAFHVLFAKMGALSWGPMRLAWPDWASLDLWALALSGLAIALLFFFRRGVIQTLLLTAGAGLALKAAGLVG